MTTGDLASPAHPATARFAGRVALVTGGTRGIGRAIATMFAREGAAVAVNYLRRRGPADETVEHLRALGVQALAVKADVRDRDRVHEMVAQVVSELGGVDYAISNAASGSNKPALKLEASGWDWTMNINTRALLFLAQETVPSMRERGGGRIVSVSSIGAARAPELHQRRGLKGGAGGAYAVPCGGARPGRGDGELRVGRCGGYRRAAALPEPGRDAGAGRAPDPSGQTGYTRGPGSDGGFPLLTGSGDDPWPDDPRGRGVYPPRLTTRGALPPVQISPAYDARRPWR